MSLLDHHDPESWRFYHYGSDDDDEPLFSFWLNIDDDTGVCIYERNAGAGKWLSTDHSDDEYTGVEPSDELRAVLGDLLDGGIDADRLESLVDYERYFVQVVHGTINDRGHAPPELVAFLEDVAGSELEF